MKSKAPKLYFTKVSAKRSVKDFKSKVEVSYKKDKVYKKIGVDKSSKFSLFCLFIFLLFLYSYVSYVRTGQVLTISFKSLIDWLAEVPDISSSFVVSDISIRGSWGAFDTIRNFINFFIGSFSVVITLCGFILQALILIIHFARFFFS